MQNRRDRLECLVSKAQTICTGIGDWGASGRDWRGLGIAVPAGRPGLEGIGDLDDEFGDQLDSFMDSEGGDDGELDSFFEDLSTIDDLEVQDDDLSAGGGDADDFGSEDLEDELAPAAAAAHRA